MEGPAGMWQSWALNPNNVAAGSMGSQCSRAELGLWILVGESLRARVWGALPRRPVCPFAHHTTPGQGRDSCSLAPGFGQQRVSPAACGQQPGAGSPEGRMVHPSPGNLRMANLMRQSRTQVANQIWERPVQSRVLTSGRRHTAGFAHGGRAWDAGLWVPLEAGEGRQGPAEPTR